MDRSCHFIVLPHAPLIADPCLSNSHRCWYRKRWLAAPSQLPMGGRSVPAQCC